MNLLLAIALICATRAQAADLVVLIGWDGADYRRVTQLVDAGLLPNLASLHGQRLAIVGRTQTSPSWVTILTGLPEYVHRSIRNPGVELPPGKTIFERLKKFGIPSAYVSEKHSELSEPFVHVPEATKYFYMGGSGPALMSEQTERCLAAIAALEGRGFLFCHYGSPDWSGHRYGGNSAEYDQALVALDGRLGRIRGHLPVDSVLLVTSDHGFERAGEPDEVERMGVNRDIKPAFGHGHYYAPHAILFSTIALLAPATNQDIAKTVAALLGVGIAYPSGRSLVP